MLPPEETFLDFIVSRNSASLTSVSTRKIRSGAICTKVILSFETLSAVCNADPNLNAIVPPGQSVTTIRTALRCCFAILGGDAV